MSKQTTKTEVANTKLQVTYLPIGSLSAYERNARSHSKAQIRKIANSIENFKFTNPILIDANSVIIAGHGRVEAAKLLGIEQVPTIRLDGLTPAQIRAYVIADNKLVLEGFWNEDILRIELQNLVLNNEIDVSLTGFSVPEIDILLGSSPDEDMDDQISEIQESAVCRTGDLWLLGKHKVLCGDTRDEFSFTTLMEKRRASMVFSDPPFNVAIAGKVSGKGAVKHGDFAMAAGEMSAKEFTKFLESTLGLMARYSTAGSVHFICMDWRHMGELLSAGDKTYDALLNLCVWAKDNGGQGSFYRSRHELVFVFRNGTGKYRNNIQLGKFGRYRTNVWEYPAVRGLSQAQTEEGNLLALHPTVKPVAMVADAILDCSKRGDLILDGFLGSGSTLIAAERVGRICYGIEFDPRYVDVTVRRWQKHAGDVAVHAITGQKFDEREEEVTNG